MSNEALIGELRSVLANGPSTGTFSRIVDLLGNGDVPQEVVDYLEPQLAHWPEDIERKAPWEWVARVCRGWSAPALALTTYVDSSWHTVQGTRPG